MTQYNGRFVNPYNFVSLAKKKGHYEETKNIHTGVIEYSITTKTDLFIPDTSDDKAFLNNSQGDALGDAHKSYRFFTIAEENQSDVKPGKANRYPAIPGSELRGMFRSMYEMLTDSCMKIVNETAVTVKRTGEIFQPGLIHRKKDGNYELVKATSERMKTEKEENQVYVHVNGKKIVPYEGQKITFNNKKDDIRYIIIGGWGGKKKSCHMFKADDEVITELEEKDFKQLNGVIESYMKQLTYKGDYDQYRKNLNQFINGKMENYYPVYYSVNKEGEKIKLMYLSPAAITKELSKSPLVDYLGVMAGCTNRNELCPACSLFGMIGKKQNLSQGSKIRFTDARMDAEFYGKNVYDPVTTLQTLNTPKISNAEFYTHNLHNAQFWTYDYYIEKGELKVYSEAEKQGLIRGRKVYLHNPEFKLQCAKPSNLNKTIQPVKVGIVFHAKLYYDGISSQQKNQLIWLLNGGDRGMLSYKIGSAKPLGFGSISTTVDSVKERRFNRTEDGNFIYDDSKEKYKILPYAENGFSENVQSAFKRVCTFDYLKGKNISYPITKDQEEEMEKKNLVDEGFRWFTEENHGRVGKKFNGMRNKRTDEKIVMSLPVITDKDLSMPVTTDKGMSASTYRMKNDNVRHKHGKSYGKQESSSDNIFQAEVLKYKKNTSIPIRILGDIPKKGAIQCSRNGINPDEVQSIYPVGTKLTIRFEKKESSGFEVYTILKKEE